MRRGRAVVAALAALAVIAALSSAPCALAVTPAAPGPRTAGFGATHLRPHAPHPQPLGPTLPIAHAGRWLTDAQGRVVIVHGTNMVNKLAPFYPSADGFDARNAAFLRSIGFNAVRIGFLWQAFEPQPGQFDLGYLRHIAQTVNTLRQHGILSVIDFHQDLLNQEFGGEGFPAWAVQTGGLPNPNLGFDYDQEANPALQHAYDAFFQNAAGPNGTGLQQYYADAWAAVAAKYEANTSILGYEIMNEPFPGTAWETCLTTLGCPTVDNELTSFYDRVVQQIRGEDAHTLVFYEPASPFNEGVNTNIGGVSGTGVGFAFHDYCLSAGTTPPCTTENGLVFQHALARVTRTQEPLLETEFGASDDTGYLESLVQDADQNMVPWMEWAYCACGDPTTVNSSEGIVVNPAKPLSGSNLITPTLNALVEPYPQVISGTPQAYAYDHTSHTFTFSYATQNPATRTDFPAGSQTQIATPAYDYPDGYSVSVSGATVTSQPDAPTLTLASAGGATQISVTVRPPA